MLKMSNSDLELNVAKEYKHILFDLYYMLNDINQKKNLNLKYEFEYNNKIERFEHKLITATRTIIFESKEKLCDYLLSHYR